MAKDARQFLRAGFVETTYSVGGGFLYLTAGMMQSPPMTHAEALSVPMRIVSTAGIRAGLTEADGQLLQELKNMFEGRGCADLSSTLVIEALDRFVKQGADLTRAGVLQYCIASAQKNLLETMLSRGAKINGSMTGITPLMMVAECIPGDRARRGQEHCRPRRLLGPRLLLPRHPWHQRLRRDLRVPSCEGEVQG